MRIQISAWFEDTFHHATATACNATHDIAKAFQSVCLSVCPSVRLSNACIIHSYTT